MTPARRTGDPHGEDETIGFDKVRQRSQSGPGSTAFLRARPVKSSRVTPASEFEYTGRRFWGMDEFPATRRPCCGAMDAKTRHARLCPRSGAQVNRHQPLVHVLSRTFKCMPTRDQVENWSSLQRRQGPLTRRCNRERRPPICYGIRLSQQSDTYRRDVCRPASGGAHTCRQR